MSEAALLRDRVYQCVKDGIDTTRDIQTHLGITRHRITVELYRLTERDMIRNENGHWRVYNKACLLAEYWRKRAA